MKITFVYPQFEKFLSKTPELDRGMVDYFLGGFTTPPSLGIPIMASWTPPEHEIELIDDNAGDRVDYDSPRDLVAINCFTPQATRAFEIADGFRARGTKVIMGGFFPSFMVEECLKHADSVNVGEVEPTWETILKDVQEGELKPLYKGGCRFDLSKMRIPRRDIFYHKETYDWDEDLVQVTRGCSYNCAMCSIPAHMGGRIRFRPIEHVVEEIKTLKYENVYLADDTLFFPQRRILEYSKTLLRDLIPLQKKYFVSSTMALKTEPEFLDLIAEAGVRNFYCTMNVDPISIRAIQGSKKEQQMLIDLVHLLEDRGIRFFGSFAVGRDWDDNSIADRVLELYTKANIRTSEFFLFTPYPGSVHWDRLEKQGRIIDREWRHYNGAHVVARHPTMGVDELYEQFITIWKEFFKLQKDRHAAHLEPLTYEKGAVSVGKPLQRRGVRGAAVVTGMGVLSPIGNSPEQVLESLRNGTHGLRPAKKIDASHFRTDIVGEIQLENYLEELDEEEKSSIDDPYIHHALIAARRALKAAGIPAEKGARRHNIALVLGTCNGGLRSAEAEYAWKHGKADRPFDERMNLQAQYYGFGKAMCGSLGIGGDVWVTTTACSSTTAALGIAQMLISKGYYDTVLVGGSDTLCVANVSGFNGLKATSTERTAPFSIPVGLNVGEAAAFWVVEDMEKALLRNAHCLARIAGHATTSDAYHPTAPDPRGDGVFRTLRNALDDSLVTKEDIGCINAHGTGTEANDRAESKGIGRFIEELPIPVVSLKSFFGHCMGSTGILEATCNIATMNDGFVPPTLNFSEPRPGCGLDYVPRELREKKYHAFLSANYAFGGNNAAVVLTKWDYPVPARPPESERVVITGTGVITSLGLGTKINLDALRERKRALVSITPLGLEGMKSELAGLIPNFRSEQIDRRLDLSGMNKISRFATGASALALCDAGLKVTRRNAEEFGISMGVCNGPPETAHMDSVFSSDTYEPDIASFSNITANSTAGWVSNALVLKGANATFAPGPHAAMQAAAYAFDILSNKKARYMLAGASDEVYDQTYYNYDLMDLLYRGSEEQEYRIRWESDKRKVLGEGAAMLALETMSSAREREADVLAEVLGYAMNQDCIPFGDPALSSEGLVYCCRRALQRSKIEADRIDVIFWAPQGNRQDRKVLEALDSVFGTRAKQMPLIATTFNTGYIESASIFVTLACALEAFKEGGFLWPQQTGLVELDDCEPMQKPRYSLVCASSDVGYNFALALKHGIDS